MDNEANVVGGRPGDAERPQESGVAALGRGGRMSRQRKSAAVLRLLRGEDLDGSRRSASAPSAPRHGGGVLALAADPEHVDVVAHEIGQIDRHRIPQAVHATARAPLLKLAYDL